MPTAVKDAPPSLTTRPPSTALVEVIPAVVGVEMTGAVGGALTVTVSNTVAVPPVLFALMV